MTADEEEGKDKVGQTFNDQNWVTLTICCWRPVLTACCETCQNVFFVLYREKRKGQWSKVSALLSLSEVNWIIAKLGLWTRRGQGQLDKADWSSCLSDFISFWRLHPCRDHWRRVRDLFLDISSCCCYSDYVFLIRILDENRTFFRMLLISVNNIHLPLACRITSFFFIYSFISLPLQTQPAPLLTAVLLAISCQKHSPIWKIKAYFFHYYQHVRIFRFHICNLTTLQT